MSPVAAQRVSKSRSPRVRIPAPAQTVRCAIYTRKSTTEGLDSDFNTLDAQREACEAYVLSHRAEGWTAVDDRYDDGGFTGGNMDRPALKRLIADVASGGMDCVVIYKIDRLSRSLTSSRSNCANEERMFSMSRPVEVEVLICWVTATSDT